MSNTARELSPTRFKELWRWEAARVGMDERARSMVRRGDCAARVLLVAAFQQVTARTSVARLLARL